MNKLSSRLEYPVAGIWPLVILAVLVAVGWFGGRTLFRLAENSFWSLNSLAVQPAYTMCREALRQLAEGRLTAGATKTERSRLRAAAAVVSGAVICAIALAVLAVVLPHADLLRGAEGVGTARHLAVVALANTVVLVAGYLAVAALVWAIADATMAQPQDLDESPSVQAPVRPGASHISLTCTPSANATGSGSKVGGRGRAATNACGGCSPNWICSMPASRSTWSWSPAT